MLRRRVRVVAAARRRLSAITLGLELKPATEWPSHLGHAWEILHDEMQVSNEAAIAMVVASVSAAHGCAQKINRRVENIVEFQVRNKLCRAFGRIAKCAKRAPAELRRRLDVAIIPLIQGEHVDLEVIEAILDAAVKVFADYSHQEAATTALAVLTYQPPGGERYMTVKNDFPGLCARDRVKSETALAALGRTSKKRRTTASDVFAALAAALQSKQSAKLNSQIHTLLVDYVTAVADVWRRAGLRPSLARHPEDPTYKSRFHRFVDLVLTAVVDPGSRRHDGDLSNVHRETRLAHQSLQPELRSIVSSALRRGDVQWLISADHITKARAPIQKTDRDTA